MRASLGRMGGYLCVYIFPQVWFLWLRAVGRKACFRGEGGGDRMEELTLVVEHDGQNGQLVPLTDPVHAPGHAEEERPVPDDVAYESLTAHGQFDAQRSSARPAETAAAAVDPGAWDAGLQLVRDEDGACHGLDGEDGV